MQATFNLRVQSDVNRILAYYEMQSDLELADAFFDEFKVKVRLALENPKRYPIYAKSFRKARLNRFPYHFLYRQTSAGIRVFVVRHNRRHPHTGMNRR